MKAIKKMKPLSNPLVNLPSEDEEQEEVMYTDLRQVMDYSRNLAIFYSGVEYEAYLDGCYNMGVRNFLMSYEYLKTKGINQLKKYPDMHLFIDSGAYTYQSDPKYLEYTPEQWEEQIHEYLRWAEKHKSSIFGMAELDLQNLVGTEVVNEWRRKYFEPFMLRTGVPVCFIYHHEGEEVWERMCQRYPYVGFSTVADDGTTYDLAGFQRMLSIAEKYNSLVHGFGMTRTSLLPQLPFYTVDSTSWKSGFRYGQIAIWNGKKVQMFKREELEGRVFPVIQSYPDIQLDTDLIGQYYEPEVLRANVYAYQKAEDFINERLRSLMYWKKQRTQKVNLDNLPDDFFPSPDWFNGSCSDAQDYARKMNLNSEYPQLVDLLHDVTSFMNWDNPEYSGMVGWYLEPAQDQLIRQLHDQFVNRIVPDKETMIEDLRKFYEDCVSGNNDKLLQLGTNFDRIVKERDDYIDDTEEELVDLTEEELKVKLHGLLPSPADATGEAPEVTALDEEVYRQVGIVPTFDEKGRFVKGQKAVRKPKKVYSTKYPKFACDTCYAAAKCPEFKAGYVCAYHKMFTRFDTRDMADIIQAMQGMVEHNMTRMQRAMVMEVLNGTVDGQVTAFIDQNMRLMMNLKQLYEFGSPEVLRQTRIVRADGSREETTQITNPQGGGILEKLFGNLTEKPKDDTIIEAEVVSEEPPKKNARYENIEED